MPGELHLCRKIREFIQTRAPNPRQWESELSLLSNRFRLSKKDIQLAIKEMDLQPEGRFPRAARARSSWTYWAKKRRSRA